MKCGETSDCGGCNRLGSSPFCIDGSCACTLPRHFVIYTSLIVVLLILFYVTICIARRSSNTTFLGHRPGYVFTTRDGKTGYYKDNPPHG